MTLRLSLIAIAVGAIMLFVLIGAEAATSILWVLAIAGAGIAIAIGVWGLIKTINREGWADPWDE